MEKNEEMSYTIFFPAVTGQNLQNGFNHCLKLRGWAFNPLFAFQMLEATVNFYCFVEIQSFIIPLLCLILVYSNTWQ